MPIQKEMTITWQGVPATVILKRLNNGERNDIMRQSTDIKFMAGTEPVVRIDPYTLKEHSLVKCIVKAPFNIDMNSIKELDFELADQIYTEVEAINSISEKKNQN